MFLKYFSKNEIFILWYFHVIYRNNLFLFLENYFDFCLRILNLVPKFSPLFSEQYFNLFFDFYLKTIPLVTLNFC